jgi:hypothetical protein
MLIALSPGASAANASGDIVDYFTWYYRQQTVNAAYQGPLDFIRDAAAAHAGAEQVLKAGPTRAVIVDRRNGYLRIHDSAGTDRILTMAVYRKKDGARLIVAGSSNCADACAFVVQFFLAETGRLTPVALNAVVPPIGAAQFMKPGHQIPKALASITPKVNFVPARFGTALTLTPWYGYEVEVRWTASHAARSGTSSWPGTATRGGSSKFTAALEGYRTAAAKGSEPKTRGINGERR